jgi:hypothetical protein
LNLVDVHTAVALMQQAQAEAMQAQLGIVAADGKPF